MSCLLKYSSLHMSVFVRGDIDPCMQIRLSKNMLYASLRVVSGAPGVHGTRQPNCHGKSTIIEKKQCSCQHSYIIL